MNIENGFFTNNEDKGPFAGLVLKKKEMMSLAANGVCSIDDLNRKVNPDGDLQWTNELEQRIIKLFENIPPVDPNTPNTIVKAYKSYLGDKYIAEKLNAPLEDDDPFSKGNLPV